jgi:hypothetical protein
MANETIKTGIQNAGDIDIADVTLICSNGKQIDMKPFMVEINLTEDIFSTSLYGNIVITDSLGIIENGPIVGEEYIRIDVGTPGLGARISKTFRVFNISDRNVVIDDKSQVFILHFCSPEVFIDTMSKIYKTFDGRVDNVASLIYLNYLNMARNIVVNAQTNQFVDSDELSTLTVLNDTDNNIKFTCPGWGAMKTLSWLASKSISKDTKSGDGLFFETSQGFYWGSVGTIINAWKSAKRVNGEFYYSPSNLRINETGTVAVQGVQYTVPNLTREYKIVENFTILDSFNTLKSNQSGYYANQILTVDMINKQYKYNNFDYVKDFDNYPHMDQYAPFTQNQFRNPNMVTQVAFQHPGVFTGTKGNISERVAAIKQNRASLLSGLSNIRIEVTVPGRSDFEAGGVVYFAMPKMGPKDESDKTEQYDNYLSGLYLVSCIRHKITDLKHTMICELVKDSFDNPIQ